MWAAVREALPLWVIWSLGACDMGPGLHYYIILILEIFVVIVSSPTLKSYSLHFPLQVTDKVFFTISIGGVEQTTDVEIGLFGGTVPKTVANFKVK